MKRKTTTKKQIQANRINAVKSTGPRTAAGRAAASGNAITHGILSDRCVVEGAFYAEDREEYAALQRGFMAELRPEGPLEEFLVEQVLGTCWRLRRVVLAEAAEAAWNVDSVWIQNEPLTWEDQWLKWNDHEDVVENMWESGWGLAVLADWLTDIRKMVSETGDVASATTELKRRFDDRPNRYVRALIRLRRQAREKAAGLAGKAVRQGLRQAALTYLDRELAAIRPRQAFQERIDRTQGRAAAESALLPAAAVLEKIGRYEGQLNRRLFRSLKELREVKRLRAEGGSAKAQG